MEDIAEQLARRDRFRRKIAQQRTPAERMQVMLQLQRRARQLLSASPEAYAHYLRRNMKKRAIHVESTDAT